MRALVQWAGDGLKVTNCGGYGKQVEVPAPEGAEVRQTLDFVALRGLDGATMKLTAYAVRGYCEAYGVNTTERKVMV